MAKTGATLHWKQITIKDVSIEWRVSSHRFLTERNLNADAHSRLADSATLLSSMYGVHNPSVESDRVQVTFSGGFVKSKFNGAADAEAAFFLWEPSPG